VTARKLYGIVGAVLLVTAGGLFAGTHLLRRELFTVEPGSKAPDFKAVTLDSSPRPRTLDDYRGKVVLLNIWATWCAPCRVEMPSIQALHQSLAQKGLKIVAVSVDDPGSDKQIRDFVNQYGLTFDILYDPDGKIRDEYQTTGYPETIIIGKDGIIRRKLIGAQDWNSPGNRALIDQLLRENAS
jgi:cytochrome c biogenesis protein CcmG/thiol:disulfide interchange protein DsbE